MPAEPEASTCSHPPVVTCYTSMLPVAPLLILLILLNVTIVSVGTVDTSIQVTKFQVPSKASVGDEIKVSCKWELKNDLLYSMKLFKDEQELYRYTPKEKSEPKSAFPVEGVHVHLDRSSKDDVYMKVRSIKATGTYKCQVIVEGTFRSALSTSKHMEVTQGPDTNRSGVWALQQQGVQPPGRLYGLQRRPMSANSGASPAVQQQQSPKGQRSGAEPTYGTPTRIVSFLIMSLTVVTLLLTSRSRAVLTGSRLCVAPM